MFRKEGQFKIARKLLLLSQTPKEVDSDGGADLFDAIPVMPLGVQPAVFSQVRFLQVVRHRVCQLDLQLLKGRFAAGLRIELIKRMRVPPSPGPVPFAPKARQSPGSPGLHSA